MSTTTLDQELEALLHDHSPDDDGFLHGVHMECQYESDRPITACHLRVNWIDYHSGVVDKPKCGICYHPDGVECPSCGCWLRAEP